MAVSDSGPYSQIAGSYCVLSVLRAYASSGAGMGQYKVLRSGLDMLVANDQLELLLSRRSGTYSSSGGALMAIPNASRNTMQLPVGCLHEALPVDAL